MFFGINNLKSNLSNDLTNEHTAIDQTPGLDHGTKNPPLRRVIFI